MSAQPYKCESCEVDCTFLRAGRFPEEATNEATYGVTWRCPECKELSLDLCPLGAVDPSKGDVRCLNCGAKAEDDSDLSKPCRDCGMPQEEALAFLHLDGSASLRTLENAEKAFDTGLYRHGFAMIDSLLLEDDQNAKLWQAKATQYQILQLNKAAITCYRRAISLAPDPLVEIALACALFDTKAHDEAVTIYDAIIKRSKEPEILAIAHANRANILEAKDVDAAIKDYEKAISYENERVTHYQNYILAFSKRKRWAEALEVAKRGGTSVRTDDDRLIMLVEEARAHNEQEKADEGLAAADKALAIDPESSRALYMRGWALGMLGRIDEGVLAIEKLLAIDPTSKDGKRALALMTAGQEKQQKKPWWKFWGS